MIRYIKNWLVWHNDVQKQLNDAGIFTVYHQFGAFTYVDTKLNTHINIDDDRSTAIPRHNTRS